jgi:hypothetical protein
MSKILQVDTGMHRAATRHWNDPAYACALLPPLHAVTVCAAAASPSHLTPGLATCVLPLRRTMNNRQLYAAQFSAGQLQVLEDECHRYIPRPMNPLAMVRK